MITPKEAARIRTIKAKTLANMPVTRADHQFILNVTIREQVAVTQEMKANAVARGFKVSGLVTV